MSPRTRSSTCRNFPKRLLVVGGGFIAVEFASIFARLGARVTQVFRADNVLRGFDEDMRVGLPRRCATPASICAPHPADAHRQGRRRPRRDAERRRPPAGRSGSCRHRPRAACQGARARSRRRRERANGAIVVDDRSRTNVASIYAVGDVTDRVNLTPVAIREGHAFADNVFGGKNIDVSHADVPSAVFTTPEVGTVGLTEAEAREAYAIVDIYSASFRPMKATLSGRSEKTIMKIVVDGETDRVLGVHILGHEAGEMAQLLGIAVRMRATKADFDATMAVHPTAAEELVTMRTRTARHMRPA
jgi:glutathione reductase (NADPH)